VAVSKRQPLESVQALADAGQKVFGESQVQEAVTKSAALPPHLDWHFIGPLQSNKVKRAARLFSTIHSVDRRKIALALDREAKSIGRTIDAFLQVNIGDEPSKHGFPLSNLAESLAPLANLANLRVLGLMAIPPNERDLEQARGWFQQMYALRQDLAQRPEWSGRPLALSMGMSHDFEIAIEEGATHVRVGSALFGERSS
jgi:pyridoxal phosphate enzyme (YggS family)